jgi:hypothetical protein
MYLNKLFEDANQTALYKFDKNAFVGKYKCGKIHDWKNYVPDEFIKDWSNLTLQEQKIIFIFAEKEADAEQWD